MLDKDQIKEALTTENVIDIMIALGADSYKKDKRGNLMFQTICHGGSSHKLYYHPDSKFFHCYTACACSYDIYALVQQVKHIDFPDAVNFVSRFIMATDGFVSINTNRELADDWQLINRYKLLQRTVEAKSLKKHNSNILNLFQPYHYEKWYKEGIPPEAIDKFGIKYDIIRNRIIIPHFDINGNLVGIKGRALNQYEIERGYKYLPIEVQGVSYAYENSLNLYGLNHTKDAIKRLKKVMIVESEKAVLQCEGFYGENNFTVAVCSSTVSQFQKHMILGLEPEEVMIAFDKEFTTEDCENNTEAYKKYILKIKRIAHMFTPYCRVYVIWDDIGLLEIKDSPTDKGKEVFEELMQNKYEILTKE